MFGQYFNIDESAFSIAPNPKYLYLSKQHEEALAHLIYGVTRKGGFVCLTGDIGTGKTTICRCMFEQLPENTDIAFVVNPKFSPKELLASICDELHITYSSFQPGIKEYVKRLNEYLIEAHSMGRSTVLVIDEAQNLSVEALEHVRALTNLETNDQKLLQIILIGQPELRTLLAKPELEQVNQRITARFHIGPLSLNETNRYINHRLLVAGAKQKIFSVANIKQIFRLSKGVPRKINILCDRVLLGAYTIRKSKISSDIINQSAQEVFGEVPAYNSMFPKALAASISIILASGLMIFAYQNYMFDKPVLKSSLNVLSEKNIQLASGDNEVGMSVENVIKTEADINKRTERQELDLEITQTKKAKMAAVDSAAQKNKNKTVDLEIYRKEINEKVINEKKANYKAASLDNYVEKTKPAKVIASDVPATIVEEKIELSLIRDKSKPGNINNGLHFTEYGKAYQQLFRLWAVDYSSTSISPCEHAFKNQLHCFQGSGSIKKVIGLNRPVLLKSKADHYEPGYIVLVSIEGEYVVVIEKGDYKLIPIPEVEENWSGEFEMLWRPLHAGISYIKPGQEGAAITSLDKKLAKLQGRNVMTPNPLVYSQDLVNQVRAFQVANNLPSDGVVGPVTQMFFNKRSADTPYLIK
ncbi:MAG: AAA family ATPase [Gammaproteobacteria bacterium]